MRRKWPGVMTAVFAGVMLQACGGGGSTEGAPTVKLPIASLLGSAETGVAGQPVKFVLSDSKAMQGQLCSFAFSNGEGREAKAAGCGDDGMPVIFPPLFMAYGKAGAYTATLTVTDSQGKSATTTWLVNVSDAIKETGKLNDTGITACWDDTAVLGPCETADLGLWAGLGQDGEMGRDMLAAKGQLIKTGGGSAGFDFTKIGQDGDRLPAAAATWNCVQDNRTGLMWEVKSADGGLRDWNKTYAWYSSDSTSNGGNAGYENGGNNTQAFVNTVNQQKLCGYADWRMPTRADLDGLVDFSKSYPGPAIDVDYFPHTKNDAYWTASTYADNFGGYYAWIVYFYSGGTYKDTKYITHPVRLVRSDR